MCGCEKVHAAHREDIPSFSSITDSTTSGDDASGGVATKHMHQRNRL